MEWMHVKCLCPHLLQLVIITYTYYLHSELILSVDRFWANEEIYYNYKANHAPEVKVSMTLIYRRLADGDVHCAASATYQMFFRLPIPNPNPIPKP